MGIFCQVNLAAKIDLETFPHAGHFSFRFFSKFDHVRFSTICTKYFVSIVFHLVLLLKTQLSAFQKEFFERKKLL